MGNLLLNSHEIQNFRGFHHLQIEHLGRVNLIVGKNNVGKSSLLEALYLYARRATPTLIWEFLDSRDESRYSPSSRAGNVEALLSALKYLFFGRKEVTTSLEPVKIGTLDSLDEVVSITVDWYAIQEDEAGNRKARLLRPEEYALVDNPVPRFTIQIGQQPELNFPLRSARIDSVATRPFSSELGEINCAYVGTNGLSEGQVGKLWDGIALTGREKEILTALRIIAPGVEGLSLVEDSRTIQRRDKVLERIPIVKIAGIDEPLPLRSLWWPTLSRHQNRLG